VAALQAGADMFTAQGRLGVPWLLLMLVQGAFDVDATMAKKTQLQNAGMWQRFLEIIMVVISGYAL